MAKSTSKKPGAGAPRRGAHVTYRSMPVTMRVLRLMLGATFLYAGIYKALDATFLDPASRGYIGRQLQGFALNSPIDFLLNRMIEHATIIGWMTMLGEIAIGLATLIGVWMLPAAVFGVVLSLTLWLSSSWAVSPYFLASDPAYLAMWIAFAAGLWPKAGIRREVAALGERRQLMQATMIGALTLAGAAIIRPFASGPAAPSSSTTPSSTPTGASTAASLKGVKVASLTSLAIGQAAKFTASDGNPAYVVRLAKDSVCAYSAVCTHQGCLVEYDPSAKQFVCPCHGASYDPARHAQVTSGPAPAPLQEYTATISGNDIVVA